MPLGVENINIEPGDRTAVFFDGNYIDSEEAAEILAMAREITDPKVKDGYFN
ncbi:MAG: hypothetical protein ACJ8F7_00730 [Gemmataceae bacterium]